MKTSIPDLRLILLDRALEHVHSDRYDEAYVDLRRLLLSLPPGYHARATVLAAIGQLRDAERQVGCRRQAS